MNRSLGYRFSKTAVLCAKVFRKSVDKSAQAPYTSPMSENAFFKWTDDLSVGFCEIDLHHKKLLLILNKFKDSLELSDADYKAQIGKIIKDLSDYTEYHFSEEEKFMKTYDCPLYETHRKMHEDFIKQVKHGLPVLVTGNKQKGAEFCSFLGNWLLNHIADADHKWAEFIHNEKA